MSTGQLVLFIVLSILFVFGVLASMSQQVNNAPGVSISAAMLLSALIIRRAIIYKR